MVKGIKSYVFPVKDAEESKNFFKQFLGEPKFDQPYYIGWKLGDLDIGLDPNGHSSGLTGPVAYFEVANIKEKVQTLQNAGAEVQQDPIDVGEGRQIARVKDLDGNVIGLLQDS